MAGHLRKMIMFHHQCDQCVRLILGVSRKQQHVDRLTTIQLARRLAVDIDRILRQHRLRWLGHVARMTDDRILKCLLFGELPASRPPHGPKKRWWDVIVSDLFAWGIPVSSWLLCRHGSSMLLTSLSGVIYVSPNLLSLMVLFPPSIAAVVDVFGDPKI